MVALLPVVAMALLPPGLAHSDVESSTASRERRRVAVAVREMMAIWKSEFESQLLAMSSKLDYLIELAATDAESRISRLEALVVCMEPAVDEVLSELLRQKSEHSANHIGDECDGWGKGLARAPLSVCESVPDHVLKVSDGTGVGSSNASTVETMDFFIGESLADSGCQTDTRMMITCDSETQWLALDAIDDYVSTLSGSIRLLDDALGYDQIPMSKEALRNKATYMLQNHSMEAVQTFRSQHNANLDRVRIGDILTKLCGNTWCMEGGGGSTWVSKGPQVKVTSVDRDCVIGARCPLTGVFGRIELVNHLFEIEGT